jgi:hypothetical protein
LYTPAPPPPPLQYSQSELLFVRQHVRPRTELLCSGVEHERSHRAACREFATFLAERRTFGFIPVLQPLCGHRICWHSCTGAGGGDTDSFTSCKDETCADELCLDFLLRRV